MPRYELGKKSYIICVVCRIAFIFSSIGEDNLVLNKTKKPEHRRKQIKEIQFKTVIHN